MFSLFKPKKTTQSTVVETATLSKAKSNPTAQRMVQEIHDAVNSSFDRHVKDTLRELGVVSQTQVTTRLKQLQDIGATSTPEVVELNRKLEKLNELKGEEDRINTLKRVFKYHRVITEKDMLSIRDKYQLGMGDLSMYIGTIPQKNLDETSRYMEWIKSCPDVRSVYHHTIYGGLEILSRLTIMAPPQEFTNPQRSVNIDDPIILNSVQLDGKMYYVIVTAWGLEAGDSLVVNPSHN